MNIEGQTAVVTASARGIGAATATLLAARGAAVVINYRHRGDEAMALVKRIEADGGRAIAVQASVSDAADVEHLFTQAQQQFGPVSILINNAAAHAVGELAQVTEADFHRLFDTNVLGALLTMQAFVRQAPASGGSIVNIASAAVTAHLPGMSIYTASKASLVAATKVAAKELGPRNIRVNAVAPGATETESLRDAHGPKSAVLDQLVAKTPLGRLGAPEDIAKIVAFLASDEANWITGELVLAAGGCG